MRRFTLSLIALLWAAVSTAAAAPEFEMPWEKAQREEQERAALTPQDQPLKTEIILNELEVVHLPQAGTLVVSSHPEAAEVYLKDPGLLFMIGRVEGTTTVVVANKEKQPIWFGEVTVAAPKGENDHAGVAAESEPEHGH